MSLATGIYVVTSVAGNRFIGRYPIEDRSLLPKQVFALPESVDAPRVRLIHRFILSTLNLMI